jgi:DNA replication protein dnaD
MNELVFNTLKEKDFIIKSYLLKVAISLNLDLNDFILLVYLTNQEEPSLNIENIKKYTYLSEDAIMESYTKLLAINLIEVTMKKDGNGLVREVINLDNIIKNITSAITREHKQSEKTNLFSLFEREFVRPLSPMEYEIINEWIRSGISEELISEALKEAIFNGVKSLRYIDKILISWKDKGYKSASDVRSSFKKEDETTNTELFSYNWLEDE